MKEDKKITPEVLTSQNLEKTVKFLAKGIIEKQKQLETDDTCFPYSRTLHHGMNCFLRLCLEAGVPLENVMKYADETAFINRFLTKSVGEWFENWPEDVKEQCQVDIWEEDDAALAGMDENGVLYPLEYCEELILDDESDISGSVDQRAFYNLLQNQSQEMYTKYRELPIPLDARVIDVNRMIEIRRQIKMDFQNEKLYTELPAVLYEPITIHDSKKCPVCGWTMTSDGKSVQCSSARCRKHVSAKDFDKLESLDPYEKGTLYRLKKGIVNYISSPGVYELELRDYCQSLGLTCRLWPHMDQYDLGVYFPDGAEWAIDVKAYSYPGKLKRTILDEHGFPQGSYEKGFFVIPDEFIDAQQIRNRNYLKTVNRCLEQIEKDYPQNRCVTCVSMKKMKAEIKKRKKVADGKL